MAVLSCLVPLVSHAQEPPPGFAESLCPRLNPPDEDCNTIALPAEVWATATTIPIKDDPDTIAAYDNLIPEPYFAIPDRREVGVILFRLEVNQSPSHDEQNDPGPGYAEGSVAIRVGFPAEDGYPYREGWWTLAQPLNDPSQYQAGRDLGLPKYMADAGFEIESDGVWRHFANDWGAGAAGKPGSQTVAGANEFEIEWTDSEPQISRERREQLWTWGQYGEPLFVQTPPYDEPGDHDPAMVKFTPVSTIPLTGLPETPLTIPPDPDIGDVKVTLEGETPLEGLDFQELLGPGPYEVPGTAAFTRGFAFITSDNLSNNQAPDDGSGGGGGGSSPPGSGSGDAECAGPAPGGEWRTFGRDLRNTRSQPAEDAIDASNVAQLEPDFIFDTKAEGSGTVQSTPIIADGCVFFGTAGAPREDGSVSDTNGWVFALNAESGKVVWKRKLAVGDPGLLCTGIIGSTPVKGGRVFAIVSQSGSPYAVALSQKTGKVLWKATLDETPMVYNCGSPVVYQDVVIAPFTGDQTGATNRGGYTLIDAETGEVLAKEYTIPDQDFNATPAFKGGGIWTTAAVDRKTGYAYFGTANPDAGAPEHERTNSIIKVDVDRTRATFGQIVDSYKGNNDRYLDTFPDAPLPCDPDENLSPYIRSVLCAQLDLDFGSSPNLVEGTGGETWVSAMQKSGVFHVANADSMEEEWQAVLGPPVFYGNGSTAATDGESFFVAASPPGQAVSLDKETGGYQWAMPVADVIHYQEMTYANGLVYTNDAKGFLHVFDAETGALAFQRWIGGDIGKPLYAEESSGSTALARNTLYVGASNYLVAYRNGARGTDGDCGGGGGCQGGGGPGGGGNGGGGGGPGGGDVSPAQSEGDESGDVGPVHGSSGDGTAGRLAGRGDGRLPFTGFGVAGLLLAATALLAGGFALWRRFAAQRRHL